MRPIDLRDDLDYRLLVVKHADSPKQTFDDLVTFEGVVRFRIRPLPRVRSIRSPRFSIAPVHPVIFDEVQVPTGYQPGAAALEPEGCTVYLLDRGDPRIGQGLPPRDSLEMALDVFATQEGITSIRWT